MKYEVVKATERHAKIVSKTMRLGDCMECATMGWTPWEGIKKSMDISTSCWTWLVDGEPAAIGGIYVMSALGGVAGGWIFTTDLVDDHKLAFVRMTLRMKKAVVGFMPKFTGCISMEYDEAIRWAQFIGMKVGSPFELGPNKAMYCEVSA